jgi:hypothetical protein
MLFLGHALLLSQPARLSPADQAARVALRRAVARLEQGSISRQQFERLVPPRNVPAWQRLQRRIHYPQTGALDLAFVLAYYGVDYRQNLQRLMLPASRIGSSQEGKSETAAEHGFNARDTLPDDLMILYRKHHDTASLGALLDLRLDGASAESQEAVIYQLWQRQPATLLRIAAGSKTRLWNIEQMVVMEGDDAKPRKQLLAELRRFGRHPDPRVAGAARRVLSMARRDFAQQRG